MDDIERRCVRIYIGKSRCKSGFFRLLLRRVSKKHLHRTRPHQKLRFFLRFRLFLIFFCGMRKEIRRSVEIQHRLNTAGHFQILSDIEFLSVTRHTGKRRKMSSR